MKTTTFTKRVFSVFSIIIMLIFYFAFIPTASAADTSTLALGCDVSDLNGFTEDSFEDFIETKEIKFAFLRYGGRGFTQGGIYTDDFFWQAVKVCKKKGIPFGIYFYSSAITKAEAKEEAKILQEVSYSLEEVKEFSLGVVLDIEQRRGARTEEILGPEMGKLAQYQVKYLIDHIASPVWVYADCDTYMVAHFDKLSGCHFWLAKPIETLDDAFKFGKTPTPKHGKVDSHQIDLGSTYGVDLNVMRTDVLEQFAV